MPNPKPNTGSHHRLRTVIASLCGTIAVSLIILSIITVWLGRTLTNTDTYVDTVAPLVSNSDIQDFAVDHVSKALLEAENAPVQEVAATLLGPAGAQGKTTEQLRTELKPLVDETVRGVVTSPEFSDLWVSTNRNLHSQLISQLDGEGSTVNLDFRPLITGIIGQLDNTQLGFVKDNLQINDNIAVLNVEADQIKNVRDGYDNFKRGQVVIVVLAIIMTVLTIVISVHHIKTLRRVAFMTGIFTAIMAGLLGFLSQLEPSGNDEQQQKLALALFNRLTGDLRTMLITVAVVSLGVALASKIFDMIRRRNTSAVARPMSKPATKK